MISCPKQGKKSTVLVKNVFTQTHIMVLNNLSLKIFIKRKTRAGKACAYRILEFQDGNLNFLKKLYTGQPCHL